MRAVLFDLGDTLIFQAHAPDLAELFTKMAQQVQPLVDSWRVTVWKLNGRHEVPPAPEADYMIHDPWEIFTLDLLPDASPAPPSPMLHEDGNAGPY